MKMVFVPVLALVTGISSSAVVVGAQPHATTLHASASLEDRVAARRAARTMADHGKTIEELRQLRQSRGQSSSASSKRSITPRPRRSALRLLRRASSSSSRRIVEDTSKLIDRRELRRNRRLGNIPAPLKFQVIEGVNTERAKVGLLPLRAHIDLETAAQRHAQDMKERDFFSHENPDGLRSNDRIKATGYGVVNAQECLCSYKVFLGENLAKGQTTVEQVIEEWMNSPSHRDAMLSKSYDEIGVGIVDDIWVLNFGSVQKTPVR